MTDSAGYFLMIGLKGLVLRDIVGAMQAAYPHLTPLRAETLPEAAQLVQSIRTLPFAFLNIGPDALMADALYGTLMSIGTRVVVMGNDAETAPEHDGLLLLNRPYWEDDILNLLKKPV